MAYVGYWSVRCPGWLFPHVLCCGEDAARLKGRSHMIGPSAVANRRPGSTLKLPELKDQSHLQWKHHLQENGTLHERSLYCEEKSFFK